MTLSMIVILDEGGSCYLIEGIKAMYPSTIVEIEPILSERLLSWKKMARLSKANKNKGTKIVANAFPGYLYSGMTK
jgi:hypothetical protein